MHLTLTPQAGLPGCPETTLHVAGDVLTIDGTTFDLSAMLDRIEDDPGEETGEATPFVGPIRRIDGVLHARVIVRLDDTAADDQPESPWIIADADGLVSIPAARKPAEVTE
jgi:hypothetical protein